MNESAPVRRPPARLRSALPVAGCLLLAVIAGLAPSAAAAQTGSGPAFTVHNVTHNSATLRVTENGSPYRSGWDYKQVNGDVHGPCQKVPGPQYEFTYNGSLSPSTQYKFIAYLWQNGQCSGGIIDEVTFTTLAAPTQPPAPNKPTGEGRNESVRLSWSSNGDGGSAITSWQFQWKSENDSDFGAFWEIPNSGASTTSHTVTGLTNGTAYQFKVRAVNDVGVGDASPASASVTPEGIVPGTPEKPAATAGNESVSLSWKTVDDRGSAITSWDYQKNENGGSFGSWTAVPSSGASTTSYTVTGLTNGTAYQFKVRAVNSVGAGDASPATDSVTPVTVPGAPGTPTATAGNAEVALTWTAGGNGGSAITSWDYRKNENGGSFGDWTAIPSSAAGTTSYTVTGLTNGTAYRFKVRAVNGVGAGTESAASASATPAVEPGKPATPTATGGVSRLTVTWTKPDDKGMSITGYDIQYRARAGDNWGDWTAGGRAGASRRTWVVDGLTNGTRYQVQVRAVNAHKNGPWSDSAEATPAGQPDTPAAPTVTPSSTPGVLEVTWTLPNGNGSPINKIFLGWKDCQNCAWTVDDGLPVTTTAKTLTGLKHGTTWYVALKVQNGVGSTAWGPTGSGKTAGTAPDDGNDGNNNDGGGSPPPSGDGQDGGDDQGGDGDDGGDGGDGGDDGGGGDGGVVIDPPDDPTIVWEGDVGLAVVGNGTVELHWRGRWTAEGGGTAVQSAATGTLAIEMRSQEHGWQEMMKGVPASAGKVRIDGLDPEIVYTFRLRRDTASGGVEHSNEVSGVPDGWRSRCRGGLRYLCLQNRRFEVRAHWSNPDVPGDMGNGGAVEVGISDESGLFWFFDPANIELVVKVLDGREINGAHWVFFGALSDVEYWLTVRDVATGMARTYYNPPKQVCGQSDLKAFEGAPPEAAAGSSTADDWAALAGIDLLGLESASLLPLDAAPADVAGLGQPGLDPESAASALPAAPFAGVDVESLGTAPLAAAAPQASAGACVPGPETLCVLNGRFALEVKFIDPNVTDPEASAEKPGYVLPSLTTEQTGFFWFFNAENIELAAKVLDGRGLNGRHWLLYGGLSDVEYTVTATDTVTGLSKTYRNEPGSVCGKIDTDAF